MLVRYFAAACAAAGVQEEHLDLPEGTTLEGLVAAMLAVERSVERSAGTHSLARIIPPVQLPPQRGRPTGPLCGPPSGGCH